MKPQFCRQIFEKSSNGKFHDNLSSGSIPVPCGDGETDKPKLTAAHRNFMNVPKKRSPCTQHEGGT